MRFLFMFICGLAAQVSYAQYPLLPQNQQHYINGTVGEERGNRNRYHYGLDLATANGTLVYSIEAGTFNQVNGAVAIGHYAYVHTINHPANLVDGVTQVPANAHIGSVTQQHVHLQQSTGDLTNITGFEEQDQTAWINPIANLAPVDNVAPNIDGARLFRQGTATDITNTLTLFGQVDIRVNAEDARINANGSGNGFGTAPHTMNWEILDINNNNAVLHTYPGLSFANVPTNASAPTVHSVNANWQTPNFEYWITNDAFTAPYDKYWNTLQQQGGDYNASAACPENALLPEGKRVRVRVNACDFSNNCDQELLPTAAGNYVIDNFKPYLKKVTIKYGGTTVYEGVWECTTACANGLKFSEIVNEKMPIGDVPNGFTIIAEASEALSQLSLSIASLGLNNLTATNISADQRTFTFTTGAITPAQFQYATARTLSFSGQDQNANVLMALQTFKNSACVTIPTRTGVNTWSNPSNVPFQNDLVHVLPVCPAISFDVNVVLNHPLDCNSQDGSIRTLVINDVQPPTSSSYSYTYNWQNEAGDILPMSGPFVVNLGPGEYCLVATDPYGCTGEDCVELVAEHFPEIYDAVEPSCVGANVGFIEVYAFDQFGGTYTFDWSTGHHTPFDFYSSIENLAPGTYSVTISSDESSCTVVKTYTVPTIQPPSPLAASFTSLQPCPGQNNGQINLTVSGGIPPYTYAWSDTPPFGANGVRTQLAPGDYACTVIDYCGAQVVTTIPLKPMQATAFTLTPGCQNQGTGSIQVSLGNPGYSYVWNTNPVQTGANVQNLRSGNVCVTVTDNRGCQLTRCGDLRNKEFIIQAENRPCEGFNDGSLDVKVYNPQSELVQVTLDGAHQPLLNPFANEISMNIPNLTSNANYSLVFNIGNCSYTHNFTMPHKAVTNKYDHYDDDDDICYYDVYCGENFIADDGFQQPPYLNFNDAHGGWLTKCYVPAYCGSVEVDEVKYNKKTVKAFIYYQILLDALVNSPHSSDYIMSLIDYYNGKGLKYCDKVRYCPATLKMTSTFPGTNGQAYSSGSCWELKCNFPVSDESFCMSQIVPNYFYSSGNPIDPTLPPVFLCEPRTYSLYELIQWKDDLLQTYLNFEGSELFDLITEWEMVEPFDSRIYCASVGFCLTDFTVLYSNVESVDCTPCPGPDYVYSYNEDIPQPCTPDENLFSVTRVYCKGGFCSGGGCCLFPVSLRNYFPGEFFFAAPPNDGQPPIHTVHKLLDHADAFVNFGEAYADGLFVPKGLFRSKEGKGLYLDYFPHTISADRQEVANVKFSYEDLDNNTHVYISHEDNSLMYYLSYEDYLQDWTKPISTTGLLEISHLSQQNNRLLVAGKFSGTLTFGSQPVTTSSSVKGFVLQISTSGDIGSIQTIQNFDPTRPLTFEKSGSTLKISGRTGTSGLSINGQVSAGSQPNEYFTVVSQTTDNTYQYQSSGITTFSGANLLKTVYSPSSGNRASLFTGPGTVKLQNQTILQLASGQIGIATFTPLGGLIWTNKLNVSSYDPSELDMTFGDDGSLFMGITFANTLTPAGGQPVTSNGGKDVAILKYETGGLLAGMQSYGSADDETVKRCRFSGGNLYFGGDYKGYTLERTIGSNIYENYPADAMYGKGYITYLPGDGIKASRERDEDYTHESRESAGTVKPDLEAYPNPFTDKIQVWLHSDQPLDHAVQLLNMLGEVVWQGKMQVDTGKHMLTINGLQQLPAGLYVLQVNTSDGQQYRYKMQKQ